jgi:hypothetical protein
MKMDEAGLLRFLETEAAAAFHHASGDVSAQRVSSLKAYMREPYGTEQEGRSQVVSSEVFDTIEGMIPDLIDVFVTSDKAVVFDPVGPEDEQGAEQATNACNHVFYKQNNGFLILYTACKDALMMKTGGVKWYWDERRTASFQTYKNATEMQIATHLATNPGAEVVGRGEPVQPDPQMVAQFAMQGLEPPTVFETVKIKTIGKAKKVTICNIPADELHVSARHNSILLDECPYVAHVSLKTLSDVHGLGFTTVTADDMKAAADEATSQDKEFRESLKGGRFGWWSEDNEADESASSGYLRDEYVLCDYDGDGIAERRHIVRLGKLVLLNEECSHVPIAAWTPYILTHRFEGLSVADLVEDFQRIGTEIWRAQLDNLDLANNQETVVLTDSQGSPLADIDDLLNRRPGGILRERVAGAIRPYSERWQGIEALPMIDLLDRAKQQRTGFTPQASGLDADALNKTALQVSKEENRSQRRSKLMARIMAECLVAPMFRGIFKTLSDNCMDTLSFRLSGGYVQIDPQEWRDGYDMSINVGTGSGDKQYQAAALQNIAQAQFAALQGPMGGRVVTEANFYAVQARIAENAGFKNPAEFWTDPKGLPPPQPPEPDPKIAAEAQKVQFMAQHQEKLKQMEQQDAAYKFQAEQQTQMQIDQNRQEWEARQKQLELEQTAQLEQVKAAFAEEQARKQFMFDQWKAELEAQTRLAIAQISAGVALKKADDDMQKHDDGIVMGGYNAAREDAVKARESEESSDD